jgi:PAT family beta-lactamase induction signal transducer AmpG
MMVVLVGLPVSKEGAFVQPDWLQSLSVYRDRRMLALFFLGFSSGLPRLLVYSTLSFWLLAEGVSVESVGLFAATSTPYSLKFLWAPVLDRVGLGAWTDRIGIRRFWMLVTQFGLMASIGALASIQPGETPWLAALICVTISTVSASQDIVIDAYRVEILATEEQGAGAAVAVFGYRVAMLVSGAGALYFSVYSGSWSQTYALMAFLMGVGVVTTFLITEPEHEKRHLQPGIVEWFRDAVGGPLRSFLQRRSWLPILCFVVVYKLGDALAAAMTNPFLIELGFSEIQIADIAKTYGLVASIVGVFLGGLLVRRLGLFRSLLISGVLQLLSNLFFCWQAIEGHNANVLVVTIGMENLSGGCGTAAFVAYLSALCDRKYTATQYALLTALSSVLRTALSTTTGHLAVWLGWTAFFGWTAVAALPGIVLVVYLRAAIVEETG